MFLSGFNDETTPLDPTFLGRGQPDPTASRHDRFVGQPVAVLADLLLSDRRRGTSRRSVNRSLHPCRQLADDHHDVGHVVDIEAVLDLDRPAAPAGGEP